jgi:hypothetical protein
MARTADSMMPPSGVGRAHHPRLGIGQQDRRAVGRQGAAGEVGRAGNHCVGFGPRRPGLMGGDGDRGMDLVAGQQGVGLDAEGGGGARPVLPHGVRIVPGADPGVEAVVDALGHPALAREEGVAHARKLAQQI